MWINYVQLLRDPDWYHMYLYIDTVGLAWRYDWENVTVCMERLQIWNWNQKTHELLLSWYGLTGIGGGKVFHCDHQDGDRYLKVNGHCDLT